MSMSCFYLDLNSDILGLGPGSFVWFLQKLFNDHRDNDDPEDYHDEHVDDHNHLDDHVFIQI